MTVSLLYTLGRLIVNQRVSETSLLLRRKTTFHFTGDSSQSTISYQYLITERLRDYMLDTAMDVDNDDGDTGGGHESVFVSLPVPTTLPVSGAHAIHFSSRNGSA